MAGWTLNVGILFDVGTAVMLSYVGYRMATLADADAALKRTLWFWVGAALFMLLDGGFALLVLNYDVSLELAGVVLAFRRLLFTFGWFAFGAWFLHLNGRPGQRLWWAYASVVTVALFLRTLDAGVEGYEIRPWSVGLVQRGIATDAWGVIGALAVLVPTAGQALRLLSLVPGLSPMQRYRCIMIASSTVFFAGMVLIGVLNRDWFWYGFLENRSIFTIATGVLMAIRPPWFLRRKGVLRVTSARQIPGVHQRQPAALRA